MKCCELGIGVKCLLLERMNVRKEFEEFHAGLDFTFTLRTIVTSKVPRVTIHQANLTSRISHEIAKSCKMNRKSIFLLAERKSLGDGNSSPIRPDTIRIQP